MRLGQGFTGAYNPSDLLIKAIFDANRINGTRQQQQQQRRKRRAVDSNPTTIAVSGMLSPTTCLLYNEPLLFAVSNKFFPEYDASNLYNTNPDFDYGAFKDLAEKHRLMGTNSTLFAFRFQSAGVYVFKVSAELSNDRKMVRYFLYLYLI